MNYWDLEYTFNMWKMHRNSLVGHFPTYHSFDHSHSPQWEYHKVQPNVPKWDRKYSIMLDRLVFVRSEYLFWYTCLTPLPVLDFVDNNKNCEDIALNMLISGITNSPPVAVNVFNAIQDYGTPHGLSTRQGHLKYKALCLDKFHEYFGWKDVLIHTSAFLYRFSEVPYERKSVDIALFPRQN